MRRGASPALQQQVTRQQQSAIMDEFFFFPTNGSASSPPSPSSFTAGHDDEVLEVVPSSDVLEQWLVDDDDDDAWGDGGGSIFVGNDDDLNSPAPVASKRRGRKPGPRTHGGPAITHVEAERQRRDRLNRRFCELRAAVPTVSRMDKASVLGDAARYIAELRRRVEQLEAKARQAVALAHQGGVATSSHPLGGEKMEVRMAGPEAAVLRLTTAAARHAPARLMDALRSLDLPVQHACVCRVGGVTVQDAVVDVSAAALWDEGRLRAALLDRLQLIN